MPRKAAHQGQAAGLALTSLVLRRTNPPGLPSSQLRSASATVCTTSCATVSTSRPSFLRSLRVALAARLAFAFAAFMVALDALASAFLVVLTALRTAFLVDRFM